MYWYVCASSNSVYIDIFVHIITLSVFLCLFMLYNLIVGNNSSWYFFLYLSCSWVITPLHHCYICVCINIFLNVIYMVTAIGLCTSYDMILGCATSWASYHAYLLYIIGYFISLSSLICMHNSGLTYRCLNYMSHALKTHIFVPCLSISHIFISIIKFFRCLLLLGQIFNWNLQHSEPHIQHHIHTILDKINIFMFHL